MITIRSKAEYAQSKLSQVKDIITNFGTTEALTELARKGFRITQVGKKTLKTNKVIISYKQFNLAQLNLKP